MQPSEEPFVETLTLEPSSPYACTKAFGDMYLRMSHDVHGLNTVVMRCVNTFGRKYDKSFFIEYLIDRMLHNQDVHIGAPESIRDYMWVDDHVNAYLLALDKAEARGQVLNVSTGVGTKNIDVAYRLADIIGFDKDKIHATSYPDKYPQRPITSDQPYLVLNSSKIRNLLGWPEPNSARRFALTSRRLLEKRNGMMLSIVIPSYSEAENLFTLLPELRRVSRDLTQHVEIIVVDTMEPTDNTEEVCQKFGVRYVRRENSDNYGDAIRTGIKETKGKYVITMDADGSHSAEFILQLWDKRTEADIVIASRFMPGGSTDNPFMLTAMSKVLNFVFRHITGVRAFDTSNSFRLYNGDLLRDQRLVCLHFDVLQELLVKVTHHDPTRVIEIPYHFRERVSGRSKRRVLQFSLNYLVTLHMLRKSTR